MKTAKENIINELRRQFPTLDIVLTEKDKEIEHLRNLFEAENKLWQKRFEWLKSYFMKKNQDGQLEWQIDELLVNINEAQNKEFDKLME